MQNCVIPAKVGIQQNLKKSRFPIRSGMTWMWKTRFLYIGLVSGILHMSTLTVHAEDIEIQNPLGYNNTTIMDLIVSVTTKLTPYVLTLATFAIVVVGFKFVYAAATGNSSALTDAKKNLMWVLIGTAVVVGAVALATAVKTFLTGL